MKTTEEIIAILEHDLEEAQSLYIEWKDKDEKEAHKHITRFYTIESILEEIGEPEEPEEVKILVTMPEEKKQKKGFLHYYLSIYSFFMFAVTFWSIANIVSFILDIINITGAVYGFIVYGVFYGIHIISYMATFVFPHGLPER